jgi:hypothetical protein
VFGDRSQRLIDDIVQELGANRRTFEACRIDSMAGRALDFVEKGRCFVVNHLEDTAWA